MRRQAVRFRRGNISAVIILQFQIILKCLLLSRGRRDAWPKIAGAAVVYPSVDKVELGRRDHARVVERVRTAGIVKRSLDGGDGRTSAGGVRSRTLGPQSYHIRHGGPRHNRRRIGQIRRHQRRAGDKSRTVGIGAICFGKDVKRTDSDRTRISTVGISPRRRRRAVGSGRRAGRKVSRKVRGPFIIFNELVKEEF